MPSYACPIAGCDYNTGDVAPEVAAALLTVHNNAHVGAAAPHNAKQKAPKLLRPSISSESTEETWNAFKARWTLFKRGTQLTPQDVTQQLFQCCDEALGNNLLRGDPNIVSKTEDEVLKAIKHLAVIPVAISVRRSDLLSVNQCDGESVRSFFARIKGKAATCHYTIDCPSNDCNQSVDFTDIIAKDVLISGLAEDEVKREVLGWPGLDNSSIEETVSFIEAKEMARDALNRHSSNSAISAHRSARNKPGKRDIQRTNCQSCNVDMEKMFWSKRQKKMVERKLCATCWRKHNPRNNLKGGSRQREPTGDDADAIAFSIDCITNNTKLEHMLFDPSSGWKSHDSMKHPTLKLSVNVDPRDYAKLGRPTPKVQPSQVNVVTDTGAQSCLWGLSDFIRCGFNVNDLIPVKHTLYAANKEKIDVSGAILLRLQGTDSAGQTRMAAVMTYVSPNTQRFYLSREALVQLGVIRKDFPRVGSADEECAIDDNKAPCGCSVRINPPPRPKELPFAPTPENIPQMKEWLVETYSSSTFNKCKHQRLPSLSGPAISLHVKPDATPRAVHTPIPVSIHWQEAVKEQLDADVAMGVIEKVPIGEPSPWCHRMVIARKPDDTPRRTVDLSPLNPHCLRETHYVKPPFQQAKEVPSHTWKTVTDAWNGFHSVPLRPEDKHFTTFITPWGRYRYKVAPQGFLASGDGYARRYDELIADIQRKSKCVDDVIMWDSELEEHWWRIIDFLILVGQGGIVLNSNKFQFCQKEATFAGFRITEDKIKPVEKFINAIKEFPVPRNITDIRSWFGLINQVGHYNRLCEVMAPFKPLLSPKQKFVWTEELDQAFRRSKQIIIDAIIEGVTIFDLHRRTCLRPDWSKVGIGFFLSQKHCSCPSQSPGCCQDGWKITLAGSRFLKPEESRYAPVEGEALAIAYSLKQTRYFTQGCDNLLVITDHKPLIAIFGDRSLDEITNPRLQSLKEKTLLWRFAIEHKPGKDNPFSDATSRHPVDSPDEDDSSWITALAVHDNEEPDDNLEADLIDIAANDIRAITWDIVRRESSQDPIIQELSQIIVSGFPPSRENLLADLQPFWKFRHDLYIIDGVVLMKRRIVIPSSLRLEVLKSLHSAHQGVTAMNERAKIEVYWPDITVDIQKTRDSCHECNRIAPSQARPVPFEPHIPTTPFEAIVCDYFLFKGWYYLVTADRLSSWTEIYRILQGSSTSGSKGLCTTLRKLMATFGVPQEVSSDGGPEFTAHETQSFFERLGIRHRNSSSYLPSSNGRAEVAVKTAKRLLMNNISADGSLDTDKMVRALLTLRNTPDAGCKLSPAEILFGRRLRDTLPSISKHISAFDNPEISNRWKDAWDLKERSLKNRCIRSMESLNQHARPLAPLKFGDKVFIQNQTGNHPKRWDREGTVMEVKDFDQYRVRMSGSGRLSLRNRQFLRKYTPLDFRSERQAGPLPVASKPSSDVSFKLPPPSPATQRDPVVQPMTPIAQPTAVNAEPPAAIIAEPPAVVNKEQSVVRETVSPRRSSRIRQPRKVYEPETGRYVIPR